MRSRRVISSAGAELGISSLLATRYMTQLVRIRLTKAGCPGLGHFTNTTAITDEHRTARAGLGKLHIRIPHGIADQECGTKPLRFSLHNIPWHQCNPYHLYQIHGNRGCTGFNIVCRYSLLDRDMLLDLCP